jgi:hypothetical protein
MPVIPCNQSPCCCGSCPCEPVSIGTLCDLDRNCNVWVEGYDASKGVPGICLLDTMEECQVLITLQRSQKAKDDLLKVTSNAYLRNLAETVPLYPGTNEGDALQNEINGTSGPPGQVSNPNAIPFYAIFRGQPPFAQ